MMPVCFRRTLGISAWTIKAQETGVVERPLQAASQKHISLTVCCLLRKVLWFCILPWYTFNLTGGGMLNGLAVVFGLCLKKFARA